MNFLFQCLFKGLSQQRTILTGAASLCQKPGSTEAELQPSLSNTKLAKFSASTTSATLRALGKQAHR